MADATTRRNLLLVEDDADTLEVFSIVLGERYEVSAYRSPLDALRGCRDVSPDLLLLDIGMQPIDGVECLQRIRAMPGHADVPAVALTGYARDDDRARFLARGFQAVVVKPILDCDDLMAVIDGLVNGSGYRAMPDLDVRAPKAKLAARGTGETNGGRAG
jgi:CheY-like chemotaxis protein